MFLWLHCGLDAAGDLAVKGLKGSSSSEKGAKVGLDPNLEPVSYTSTSSSLTESTARMETSGSGGERPLLLPALP